MLRQYKGKLDYLLVTREKIKELNIFFESGLPKDEYNVIKPFLDKLITRNEVYIAYMEKLVYDN